MHRQPLLTLLAQHTPTDAVEADMTARTLAFVKNNPRCFERELTDGHVTGSAWITSPTGHHVLLIHHRKLDRWFQPGGHADGNPDVGDVALQEAEEETGLANLTLFSPAIFDVDIHRIPDRGNVPGHWHYDIRFLIRISLESAEGTFGENCEVKAIRWVNHQEANELAASESISRMLRKSCILP